MFGQKRRLEACQIALGCEEESLPGLSSLGGWRRIEDEGSRYTLNSRLTRSNLPRDLGGQKVKIWCHISAGRADLSTMGSSSPCMPSRGCSNFTFLTASRALGPSSLSDISPGDLRFLGALSSGWLLATGFEVVEGRVSSTGKDCGWEFARCGSSSSSVWGSIETSDAESSASTSSSWSFIGDACASLPLLLSSSGRKSAAEASGSAAATCTAPAPG